MLKIWYYANIEYMKDAPLYFDNVYEEITAILCSCTQNKLYGKDSKNNTVCKNIRTEMGCGGMEYV